MQFTLTEEQRAAVYSNANSILLIAGPGSGKTTVLTAKVIHYIKDKNVPEQRIHAFTFTNKATNEMERRISKALDREHNVNISNFHSYAYQKLKEYLGMDLEVVNDKEKKGIIENLILERKYTININDTVDEISRIKNMMPLKETKLHLKFQIIDIYYAYEDYLKERNKIDFDGMNLEFLRLLKEDKYFRELMKSELDYVLVDEAQDINWVQYEILLIITEDHNNLCMVGDPYPRNI